MISFPNCKINLGLNIISKRDDGFHNLETVFLPVPLCDALEIIQSPNKETVVEFACSGLPVAGDDKDNLCVKAYWLLKKNHPQLPPVKMHLLKAIPMGAGLGGGSADGAFTLIMLNKKFSLGIGDGDLMQYALHLGSDCPFFVLNKPCFAQKRGEMLAEIKLGFAGGYKLLLVNPGIHVNTGWAFSQIKPRQPLKSIPEILGKPISTWKDELVNDFEAPVIGHYPVLGEIRQQLYGLGALYAGMSGSGSTFFGIFAKTTTVESRTFPAGYFVKELSL
jgi:4-diphosphocytidyl-2-C-methyl-D-erythritol kinase